jgi:hypothetical protein
MGVVYWGLPPILAIGLKQHLAIDTLIETGTFKGETAAWAAEHFGRVVTIEAHEPLFSAARTRLQPLRNVEVVPGHSASVLMTLVPRLPSRSMFWLDAHWSGAGTAGEDEECPLLEEITMIDSSRYQHVIIVDDARMFINPPPPPHRPDHWPSIGTVVDHLRARFSDAYIAICDDVIVRVPAEARAACEQLMGQTGQELQEAQRTVARLRQA